MATSVKITALNPIGANIAYSTLLPVVNMAGTPTTEKATAQVLGNLILNGAGGSYFPAAAQAVLAQTVTNAAQPNITSVGTLTSLTVSANVNAGNVNGGNLVVANYFSGDGGFLSNVSSSYGNANVANYLPTYAGNIGGIVSTANVAYSVSVGNVSGIGNIATINLDGNVSNVLHGDGSWSADVTDYGNANVANYLPTFAGTVGANRISSNALSGSNVEVSANGAVFVFGQGGALYWPAPSPSYQWAIEPNANNEFEIHSHSNVVISTDTSNANLHFTFDSMGVFTAETVVRTIPVTVSALPAAATVGAGARAFVTDADSATFGAPAVGGAANSMPVFSDGTGWFIG
jgi:hypothetical protein